MAPVKRSTTATQRETRATRGSALAKKKAAAAEKKTASPVSKKTAAEPPTTSTTRRSRRIAEGDTQDDVVSQEHDKVSPKPSRSRSSKSVVKRSPIAKKTTIAPRRRIKVTPLDAPDEPAVEVEAKTTRSQTRRATPEKPSKIRTKRPGGKSEVMSTDDLPEDEPVPAPKTRSTRKTSVEDKSDVQMITATTKTRGRPKKTCNAGVTGVVTSIDSQTPAPRATRSRHADSNRQFKPSEGEEEVQPAKTASRTQKKVTFQELPEEDKENRPLPSSKAKKTTIAKREAKLAAPGTGLRAKPLRKAATATTTTAKQSKKATVKDENSSVSNDKTEDKEAKITRVLTPKRITQVAKFVPMEDAGAESSDGEDELNGGKTPVRDLAISPRRPPTSALGRAISPAKKLDFAQILAQSSVNSDSDGRREGLMNVGVLTSPARRFPASPFKDSLKESPKRGLGDGTKSLFRGDNHLQSDVTASIVLNPANVTTASQTMNTLLQSPKRSVNLDSNFFSQSTMKNSTARSPFKSSLLGTPAKRLFSPTKKSSTASARKISEFTMDIDGLSDGEREGQDTAENVHTEASASSHFRVSSSPIRPCRVESDADVFDESILPIGSPLKVQPSPLKNAFITAEANAQHSDIPYKNHENNEEPSANEIYEDQSGIDPSQLQIVQISPSALENATDDQHGRNDADEVPTPSTRPHIDAHSPDTRMSGVRSHQTQDAGRRPSLSQLLFRTGDPRDSSESSEDELASEKNQDRSTPARHEDLLPTKSRQSVGRPRQSAGRDFGFTPLAAQMSGWLASSPAKTPKPNGSRSMRVGSFEFSPLAGQHIDGEVVISRDSTPIQKLRARQSLAASSSRSRTPLGVSQSLDLFSDGTTSEGLVKTPQFEQYMDIQAMDESLDDSVQDVNVHVHSENHESPQITNIDSQHNPIETGGQDTVSIDEAEIDENLAVETERDLTTDLVNFTHASDTAMLDFEQLAKEADALAPPSPAISNQIEVRSLEDSFDSMSSCDQPDDVVEPIDAQMSDVGAANATNSASSPLPTEARSPILHPTLLTNDSPSTLIIDRSSSPMVSPKRSDHSLTVSESTASITPLRPTARLNRSRVFNTVVSKVPLKPEGQMSPIKIKKKRAQSFGDTNTSPPKRLSLNSLQKLVVPDDSKTCESPDRRGRTSVAPSPGGTSTPATRYSRSSLGGFSAVTTPGQMSFNADDFGDSTLDGIEVPDDFDQTVNDSAQLMPAALEKPVTTSASATPRAVSAYTPATIRTSRRVTTPATIKKTPGTINKAIARESTGSAARMPLKPVGDGVLNGAVVYVDVHTSEGADASGIFIELLTQLGAKCVRDWRWNSRASRMSLVEAENDEAEQRIGITHVVYKDGGKRTLEKVRDTKGEVWCVGVAWVLDCERQNKWLDEDSYAVDTSLLPRGGSRRRKSMEPRALLVGGDGSVSASKARRSVSAEMSELMKQQLVKTPARSKDTAHNGSEGVDGNDDDDDDDDEDYLTQAMATPTGFVSYDPRTAMTPGTPYLNGQGKNLVQMTAPPKQQTGRRLFQDNDDEENDENDDTFLDNSVHGLDGSKSVRDAKKFRMKNLSMKNRRRTLGFQPVVGSPLSRI